MKGPPLVKSLGIIGWKPKNHNYLVLPQISHKLLNHACFTSNLVQTIIIIVLPSFYPSGLSSCFSFLDMNFEACCNLLSIQLYTWLTIFSLRRVCISICSYYVSCSSWSGIVKIWSMPQVTRIGTLKGHTARATDVVFSPVDDILVTASADRTAKLWKTDGSLLKSFEGHLDRLARISFHPSGKYLGTASFDKTWRLWDINTGLELLLQEGHSRSIYGIAFHPDGSLVASCGLDALTRVWDLRTGRSILALEGHVKPVLGASFSPNGYRLATGGEDNTCRIWDLRKRKCEYTIPAHSNLISQVKYEPQEGYFLATASYDTKAMVWSGQDFKPIKTLAGHEAKVTGLDISTDGQQIVTVAHDRTIKIWSSRSREIEKSGMDLD